MYFSAEMESLLCEYEAFCAAETERYDRRKQTKDAANSCDNRSRMIAVPIEK